MIHTAAILDDAAVEALTVEQMDRALRVKASACIPRIPALADAVTGALGPWLDRPLALFGHRMGALVGFEVARRLEAERGVVPAALFVSGRPHPPAEPPRAARRRRAGRRDPADGRDRLARARRRRHAAPDPAGVPERLHRRRVLPIHQRPTPDLARDGPERSRCSGGSAGGDPRLGRHSDGLFAEHLFPGDHFYLVDHLAAIAEIVQAELFGADDAAGRTVHAAPAF